MRKISVTTVVVTYVFDAVREDSMSFSCFGMHFAGIHLDKQDETMTDNKKRRKKRLVDLSLIHI